MNRTLCKRPGALMRLVFLVLATGSVFSCVTIPGRSVVYDVTVRGLQDEEMERKLLDVSDAWLFRKDPEMKADLDALEHRFRADVINMRRYLHAAGYNAASVSVSVVTNRHRPELIFSVAGTNRYRIRDVKISPAAVENPSLSGWTNTLTGTPVDYARIDAGGRRLVRRLKNGGYPDASLAEKILLLDHESREAEVRYTLAPGNPAVFGALGIDGLRRVKPRVVTRMVDWKEGEPFAQRELDEFGRRLTESGLFSYVNVENQRRADHPEFQDIHVRLQERRRRTISLGLGYQSDVGAESNMRWEHRNLFGSGQKLELDAEYAIDQWLGAAILTLPLVGRDTDLDLGVKVADEDSDAYKVRYEQVYFRLQQRIDSEWQLLYGGSLRQSDVDQFDDIESYLQASLPVTLIRNTRDDSLNPSRGTHMVLQAEPTYDLLNPSAYLRTLFTPAAYVPISGNRAVLAVRLTLGAISGAAAGDVPADLRFYAGGGQSIRGYEYQSVGPRRDGSPSGGLSLVESSIELRLRAGRDLGFVLFVDGGSSYEPQVSDFSESYQWGAGLGVRYFTGVGPIRLDAGVPVNPREGIDKNYQFYFSIGQAF